MPELKPGDTFRRKDGHQIKVMAVSGNWAMVRIKGCVPSCIYIPNLLKNHQRTEAPDVSNP